MIILVKVRKSELEEMGLSEAELKQAVIADLCNGDVDHEYCGFSVGVILIEEVKDENQYGGF